MLHRCVVKSSERSTILTLPVLASREELELAGIVCDVSTGEDQFAIGTGMLMPTLYHLM